MTSSTPTLVRFTDLYPAKITPLPEGVPEGVKLRVVITDQYLTVAWIYGSGEIQRVDIELEDGDVGPEVTYAGGTVKGYTVSRHGACSTCGGGRRMLGWNPFPGVRYIEEPRKQVELQQRVSVPRTGDGLIPPRYTRR
mgnify:CR=1 FL=1